MTESRPGNCFRSSDSSKDPHVATANDDQGVDRGLDRGPPQARSVTMFAVEQVRVLTADRHSNASASVVTITRHGSTDSALRAVRESA